MPTYPLSRDIQLTTANNGDLFDLGPAGQGGEGGVWEITFVPDASFAGGFGVVGRPSGQKAKDNGVAFAGVPYRRVTLNGVASDYAMVSDPLNITGQTTIQVPSNALSIGILVAITAGWCWVYVAEVGGAAPV